MFASLIRFNFSRLRFSRDLYEYCLFWRWILNNRFLLNWIRIYSTSRRIYIFWIVSKRIVHDSHVFFRFKNILICRLNKLLRRHLKKFQSEIYIILKRNKRVCKFKRHYSIFVLFVIILKSYFSFIFTFYTNKIIRCLNI
jgi:hypothetical protein